MSKSIAIVAGATAFSVIAGTFAVTLLARSNHDCGATAIAGGDIGGPFELISETGETVTDVDLITEPTLIYFGYTYCPDFCPIDAARNAAAVDILAEKGIDATPVFITVDPERDTAEVVGYYADNFHDKMIGLTGTPEQIADVAREYRVVYSKADDDPEYYLMAHSTFTYLVLPDEGFVEFFRTQQTPEEVAETSACYIEA